LAELHLCAVFSLLCKRALSVLAVVCACPLPIALTAHPPTSVVTDVVGSVGMSMPAMCNEGHAASDILGVRDGLQVSRIDTGVVPTQVVKFETFRYWPNKDVVGELVRVHGSAANSIRAGMGHSVPVLVEIPGPVPATFGLLDPVEEELLQCLYRPTLLVLVAAGDTTVNRVAISPRREKLNLAHRTDFLGEYGGPALNTAQNATEDPLCIVWAELASALGTRFQRKSSVKGTKAVAATVDTMASIPGEGFSAFRTDFRERHSFLQHSPGFQGGAEAGGHSVFGVGSYLAPIPTGKSTTSQWKMQSNSPVGKKEV
jgi:hypothetical protein